MSSFCEKCGRELQDGQICPNCHPQPNVEVKDNVNTLPTMPKGIKRFFWCCNSENYKTLSQKQKMSFIGMLVALIFGICFIAGTVFVSILIYEPDTTPIINYNSSSNLASQSSTYKNTVESSDNILGLRFKTTVPEFVEHYNQAINSGNEDELFVSLYSIDIQKAISGNQDSGFDTKMFEVYDAYGQPIFIITLYCEESTQKIVQLSFAIVKTEYDRLNLSGKKCVLRCRNYACLALDTSLSFNQIDANWQTTLKSESTNGTYYDDGIVYSYTTNEMFDYCKFVATTYDYYKSTLLQ